MQTTISFATKSKALSTPAHSKLSRHVASHIQQQIYARSQRKRSFVLARTHKLITVAVVCLELFFLRFRADDDGFGCGDDLLVIADAFVIAEVPWQRPVVGRDDRDAGVVAGF